MLNLYLQMSVSGILENITGVGAIFLLCLYFLPAIIAFSRGKSSAVAILILNLFLGWTFIGWIIALVWAVSANSRPQQVIINNGVQPGKNSQLKATDSNRNPVPAEPQASAINLKTVSQENRISQLRDLKQLLDEGVLTQEEFIQ